MDLVIDSYVPFHLPETLGSFIWYVGNDLFESFHERLNLRVGHSTGCCTRLLIISLSARPLSLCGLFCLWFRLCHGNEGCCHVWAYYFVYLCFRII